MKKDLLNNYKPILILMLLISFFSFSNANAAVVGGCVDSGVSFQNVAKLGSNYVNQANKYYEIGPGVLDNNTLSLNFCTDWKFHDTETGQEQVGFRVDFCTSINNFNLLIENRSENNIDYYSDNGSTTYITWSGNPVPCYSAFVRFKLSYTDNVGNSLNNFTTYTDIDQDFQFTNNSAYWGSLKFINLVYYNDEDYANALNIFKETSNLEETNRRLNDLNNNISSTNDKLDNVQGAIGETNDKLDDIYNADIDSSDKELPSTDSFDDYASKENTLKESISKADLTSLNIGIDVASSSFIWDTMTNFIKSNTVVFGLFISILSIGIIKLALGR